MSTDEKRQQVSDRLRRDKNRAAMAKKNIEAAIAEIESLEFMEFRKDLKTSLRTAYQDLDWWNDFLTPEVVDVRSIYVHNIANYRD